VPLQKWPQAHVPAAAICCYGPIIMLSLSCYVFLHKFLFNPHLDLEHDYIIRKPIVHRILRYIPRGKYCQLFTHELNAFLSVMSPIETMHTQMPNNARNHARNSPFPLRHVDFHLTHECLSPHTHHAKRQLDRSTHFHTMTQQSSHWLQWDAAN